MVVLPGAGGDATAGEGGGQGLYFHMAGCALEQAYHLLEMKCMKD
jgi:hypothetical protein